MRTFDVAERRARLSRRHRLAPGHRAAGVVEATESVVCLHATDPTTVHLSAWARVDGMTVADLEAALYTERSLVKHLCLRRTLWVVRRGDLAEVTAAAGLVVAERERRRLVKEVEQAGLVPDGAAWLEEASAGVLAALAEHGELTSSQLRDVVPALHGATTYAPDKPYGGTAPVGPRVLTTLSAAGSVVRASNLGRWYVSRPTWARTEDWLGAVPEPPAPPEAMAALVRRWLVAFGPATVNDIKWWLGSTLTAVRAALADIGAVEVDLHGAPGVALADDLEPVAPVEPYAALLPGLDPTTMGWADRDWYLGPHRAQLFDRNGNAGATAWWDGRVVGGWNQPKGGDVRLQLLEDVGTDARAALEGEADRLTRWLDGVRVSPRFPSPLSRATADAP